MAKGDSLDLRQRVWSAWQNGEGSQRELIGDQFEVGAAGFLGDAKFQRGSSFLDILRPEGTEGSFKKIRASPFSLPLSEQAQVATRPAVA